MSRLRGISLVILTKSSCLLKSAFQQQRKSSVMVYHRFRQNYALSGCLNYIFYETSLQSWNSHSLTLEIVYGDVDIDVCFICQTSEVTDAILHDVLKFGAVVVINLGTLKCGMDLNL